MSIEASNPQINATVSASAGSGKTWMLITRIVRLLMAGHEPGGILALTFTRKAAAEMQQRLAERLYELATIDDPLLKKQLDELGIEPNETNCQRARELYEFHQYCDFPVRTQTFHSFCQDILARFPLEADIPPGFDLLENSSLLIQQARNALFNEAALDMGSSLAKNLEALSSACDGLANMRSSLDSFLMHRSDWWAFTETAKHPCAYATKILQNQLNFDKDTDPVKDFFNHLVDLKSFAPLLAKHDTKTNLLMVSKLEIVLPKHEFNINDFECVRSCFLTQKNEPLARKDSKALRKKLADDTDHYLELHQIISAKIIHCIDQQNIQKTFELNRLWYLCGERYVEHYQKLKQELRQLDFTDLEWKTYTLLQHSENALWIQYKLDQRINHFLIDEFQDTNPTQWQLILPLLEEMAASEEQGSRSIFLVGDEKQSIYSFRRAKPELQKQASDWLQSHLNAKAFPLNKSWRSSPAIIDIVNGVFEEEQFKPLLPDFKAHETNKASLPGKIELLPLIKAQEKDKPDKSIASVLRMPLEMPRENKVSIHLEEGKQIAQSIRSLVDKNTLIGEGDDAHAINYDDIFILVRKRANLIHYEQALREVGIPYLSANKGTLMDCLEIRDMEALLDTLLTPFNNLSLAQVLKSPLFDASDDDLIQIARHKPQSKENNLWIHRIAELHQSLAEDHPVHRAHTCITRWRSLVDKIPVHDLLDRIYSEANLLNRYKTASPDTLKPRVQANLIRFLELALTLDSGRYPSLMNFLQNLRSLKTINLDAPDEAPMETEESRVHIMTIHASKGLEAPVVFLADTISIMKDRYAYSATVDWPVESTRPEIFQLMASSAHRDSISRKEIEKQEIVQSREAANLLYVAITRAKQCLFISACLPERGNTLDWYNDIKVAIKKIGEEIDEDHWLYEPEKMQQDALRTNRTDDVTTDIDPQLLKQLSQPVHLPANPYQVIAPSKAIQVSEHLDGDEDGLVRGLMIHRCFELLNQNNIMSKDQVLQVLSSEFSLEDEQQRSSCFDETEYCMHREHLQGVFQPPANAQTFNELPIQYGGENHMVMGIIDRLIVSDDEALIIDYKSHSGIEEQDTVQLVEQYQPQMQLYADGIKQIWPDKNVKAALLFTYFASLEYVAV